MRTLSRLALAPLVLAASLTFAASAHAADPAVGDALDAYSEESLVHQQRLTWYVKYMLDGGVPSAEELDDLVASGWDYRQRGIELRAWVRSSLGAPVNRADRFLLDAAGSFSSAAQEMWRAASSMRRAVDLQGSPSSVFTALHRAEADVEGAVNHFDEGDRGIQAYAQAIKLYR